MRSLTRSTMRLITSGWTTPGLSTSARAITGMNMGMNTGTSRRTDGRSTLARRLGMGVTVVALVVERKIPPVNRDIVTGSRLLDQGLEEAVGAFLSQLGENFGPRRVQGEHLGRLALGHLEDVEAIVGRHQTADLAGLQ